MGMRNGSTQDKPAPGDKTDVQKSGPASYYGLPILKPSPYHWKTALSYIVEALGGGSQIIGTLVQGNGRGRDLQLVRAARYLALASSLLSPALLISELHRPGLWYNMLRIFRPSSSMSIGNLSLVGFGLFSALAALGRLLEDLGHRKAGRRLSRLSSLPAAAAGGMICLYPGTELEQTCTPFWAVGHPLLAPLFAATGMSVGTAAMTLAGRKLDISAVTSRQLNLFGLLTALCQLLIVLRLEQKWDKRGLASRSTIIALGIVLPLLLRTRLFIATKDEPRYQIAAASATLVGSFLLYRHVLQAGNVSADDPELYLASTRTENPAGKRGGVGSILPPLSLIAVGCLAWFFWKRR